MPLDEHAIRKSRLAFSRREIVRPLVLFGVAMTAYLATTAGILAVPTAVAIALVPISTLCITALFVVGHDACHQSLTSSGRLNHVIGRIAFLPALTSYSLWDNEHNRRHHRWNNIKHLDHIFAPMSAEEFAAASTAGRYWYACSRSAAGVPFYYIYETWLKRLIFPRSSIVETIRIEHWADTALLCGFVAGYSVLLAIVGGWFGKSVAESVVLGLVLPFIFVSMMISVVIFVHHTHFAVPWYASIEEWKHNRGSIYGTVHVRLPSTARKVSLNIMVHNAHHYAPGVPLYHLPEMQDELATPELVTWKWSLSAYREVCARCKLFDFSQSRWTDFAGIATSGPLATKVPTAALAAV
jgi:omega-6 fatty acid desaturase (delta-12 desaturase)